MFFGKLISGHFDILMCHYSQLKKSYFSGLSKNGILGSILQGLSAQITPKHIWKTQASTNTIQIPLGNHIDTPQTSTYNTRHQQTPTDTNRHQQTPTDTNRRQQTLPGAFWWVWQCLLVSVGVCWCLLASCVVWRCLGGYLWGFLRVYDWYLGTFEVIGCVWGLSECPVLSE